MVATCDTSGRVVFLIVIAASTGSGWVGAEKRQRIDSRWRDREVVIDGDHREWAWPLLQVDEKHTVTAAAMNDGQFLYIVLSTSDPVRHAQILRDGLIVWFDPGGGDSKHFGVKFPVGTRSEVRGRRAARPDPAQPPEPVDPVNRLELFGPKKDDARSLVPDVARGIMVKVGNVDGSLVYELEVPIQAGADFPYAIEAKPGAAIGFGLETPKPEAKSSDDEGRRGGMGGLGRGGIGRMGGGPRGERGREPAKPLKAWATIQLAVNSGS